MRKCHNEETCKGKYHTQCHPYTAKVQNIRYMYYVKQTNYSIIYLIQCWKQQKQAFRRQQAISLLFENPWPGRMQNSECASKCDILYGHIQHDCIGNIGMQGVQEPVWGRGLSFSFGGEDLKPLEVATLNGLYRHSNVITYLKCPYDQIFNIHVFTFLYTIGLP